MLLLVGLGNPGDQYYDNRHNVGFMAVDEIVRRHRFPAWRRKFKSEISEGLLGIAKVLAMKPQTFMNRSGEAVAEAVNFYKLSPSDVVVLHDELDLPPGKVRMKVGGGHAGHNGLRDIERHIGAGFRRVRIGIGHPGDKSRVTGYVLSDFTKSDDVWFDPLIEAIADAAPYLATGQDEKFMTRVAMLTQQDQKDGT
ncbi:aminoacyl-tRNA hydrolase [Emcibacter sp. SYSU 3D8]|uniref:aminoacyl-tRNA hydrolase n=1 Tax=Emcibacter sp. SYSU 3D8 TaxID=3133969 RepID=UPI0031FF27E4